MKVSLSTGSLYVYPLRQIFRLAKRAGFDGVELVIGPEVDWRGAGYVKRLSQEFNLSVFTVHPPLYGFPGWSQINETYEPYVDRALAITQAVGAELMVVHTPRARSYRDVTGGGFVNKVVQTRRASNGCGPRLALENGSRFREADHGYILRSLAELREFADAHDFPLTLDTAHVGTWDLDLLDSLNFFDGRIANVHFSDLREPPDWIMRQPRLHSYFRQHQFPGSGRLPLVECLRELQRRGYRGPITYELSPVALEFWAPWRVERHLRECLKFVRDALDSGVM